MSPLPCIYAEYLSLRQVGSILSFSMKEKYCVLTPKKLSVYKNQASFNHGAACENELVVKAIVEWNGKGRFHTYPNAFKMFTVEGNTYEASAMNRNEYFQWMRWIGAICNTKRRNIKALSDKLAAPSGNSDIHEISLNNLDSKNVKSPRDPHGKLKQKRYSDKLKKKREKMKLSQENQLESMEQNQQYEDLLSQQIDLEGVLASRQINQLPSFIRNRTLKKHSSEVDLLQTKKTLRKQLKDSKTL